MTPVEAADELVAWCQEAYELWKRDKAMTEPITSITIELPWPPKELSPNARPTWREKAFAVRTARAGAFLDAFSECNRTGFAIPHTGERIPVRWTFHPPDDGRERDEDNIVASMKAYQDGLAQALGVNDKRFKNEREFAQPEGKGSVEVRIG